MRKHYATSTQPGVNISDMKLDVAGTNDSAAVEQTGADGGEKCTDNKSKVLQVAAPGALMTFISS